MLENIFFAAIFITFVSLNKGLNHFLLGFQLNFICEFKNIFISQSKILKIVSKLMLFFYVFLNFKYDKQ
jgi:hypothetical protein